MTAPPRLPISVCLIAGNEAQRIRRALESIAAWTSEIVVVLNDDVNDGTDKIAGSFGAKVFREPWAGFIAQKNSVAAKAGQPWILDSMRTKRFPRNCAMKFYAVLLPGTPVPAPR